MSVPFLVKDIFPGWVSSNPSNLTAVGNTLYFTADNGVNGVELWKSNGTGAGTVLVRDIHPGSNSSNPSNLTAVGNILFFTSDNGFNGWELWKSDGTAAGTVLVRDINPGSASSNIRNLTAVGNTLFFEANDGVNGEELWKSDGTNAGTVLVTDIRPGSTSSNIRYLTTVGNTLFFEANDGVNGEELWKSDGTAAGTVLVRDINPGSASSTIRNLTAVGNTLFFGANNGVNGQELWKSDGTNAGTVLVTDIRPGSTSFIPRYLTAVGNTLYFTPPPISILRQELWKSDGTTTGTVIVGYVNRYDFYSSVLNPTAVGNTLYYVTGDDFFGHELWKSDGATADPALVKDIRPGSASSDPFELTVVGNTLFFSAEDGLNGRELWVLNTNSQFSTFLAISATNANRPEGNSGSTLFTFTITRSGSIEASNSVNWEVTGIGANPANTTDFIGGILPSGVVAFAAGETTKVITISVRGDITVEADETFGVTLSNSTNGVGITTASATGTIQNEDTNLTLSTTNANRSEGNSGSTAFTFIVTRSGNINRSNTVNWAVTGTGSNPASSSDFVGGVLPTGTLSFTAGETSKVITVNVRGDNTVESNETFRIALNNPTNGATITTASATGTIQNDDTNFVFGTTGNDILVGTSGADSLIGFTGNDFYVVNNIGDVVVESPGASEGTQDTVVSTISYTLPNNVENLTLDGSLNLSGTGNALNNKIVGNTGKNRLNGGAGADTLTGGAGNDIFVFRFGESTVTALDRITDFAIGADKIDLLTQGGAATGAPAGFTRAANSATTNINTIVNNVFADSNGAQAGNQALGLNSAALVLAGTSTYLIINDGTAGFQSANDLVINLTGLTGTLPALGSISVNTFFV